MNNEKLILHLDKIADLYIFAADSARLKSFRSLARKIETLSLEISSSNVSSIKLSGLGESTLEVIKQFVDKEIVLAMMNSLKNIPPKRL